ncbi:uncharacterized protein LOC125653259 [Ostrea edulis]|uniref:uncharacterized protein LOC125653259 n=1 Tax=Ostrea edulis TaxID=37623 RepID=UPI0020958700|nr:uncharacterized protein LOC125653259 [Ostrea edulis]
MECLHLLIIVTALGFSDTKYCTYYEKGLDWKSWKTNSSSYNLHYKIKKSRVYCSFDEYCCGSSCCRNTSYTTYNYYYYDSYKSTYTEDSYEISSGSSLGIAFALVVGFSFCITCCVACSKRSENTDSPLPMRNAQPIVAYSSNNGTVVIRHTQQDEVLSTSSTSSTSDREGSSHGSELQTIGPIRSFGSPSNGIQGPRLSASAMEEPPPPYDVVMSQNYPIINETKHTESTEDDS